MIKMRAIDAEELHNALFRLGGNISLEAFTRFERLILGAPTVDLVKHGHYNYIKYLYLVDGYYVVNETMQCSECNNSSLNDGCNYCSKCGAKMDEEPRFFRKKTIFVEGENALVPISHTEYKCAEEWEYEIDRC